ncbi:hypothetical protein AB5I39_08535 [Sphingomonas sp. MMS24-J45]|uniref:hypothetical protein n=1 Tax=Sphingomonas sp. MMS24-J45 TaxID=3238806 RepID=UPI00384A5F18
MQDLTLTRRSMIATAALAAGGCHQGIAIGRPAAPRTVGDAHTHLFNASDLPVANFVRYVILPSRYGAMPGWAKAVIDLFARFYKSFAASARAEMGRAAGFAEGDLDPEDFGLRIAEFINREIDAANAKAGDAEAADLARSYRELNAAVAVDAGGSQAGFVDPERASPSAFALAARRGVTGPVAPGETADRTSSAAFGAAGLGDAVRMIGWGYELLLSRDAHVRNYLARHVTPGRLPGRLINHLVDYDVWLDDGPASGSSMFEQVEVMARIAVRYRGTLDIATFAGYCPLKNSIERLRGGTTTLDRLLGMHAQGKVAGFKLYPPMGFQATGNAGLADAAFDPREKGRVTALDRWHSAGGKGKLGQALDASLEAFYAVCAARGIPLMAHAANSNGAGPNFSRRADHLFWKQVAARHPIRLSLGHLAGQVRPFCEAVAKGPPYPADDWALATSIELLDAGSKGAEVYGDLAYMEELIDDPQLARDFFLALRTAYGKRDPNLTRILYGTDWIMLGIERHHERYLDQVVAGMQAANYSPLQQSNILGGNLRRFLRR